MITLPKAITFDCYGTPIGWESAIQQFFAESLDAKGIGYVNPRTLQTEWEEIQFRYIQEKYRPYRQVLRDTLRMVFNNYRIPTNNEECDEFADSMGVLEAILGIPSISKHPLSHHPEFRTLELLSARRRGTRKKQVRT